MGLVLRDALRCLCLKIGWSYAVFWRAVGFQEQRYLIWEDGYCGGKPGGMSGFEAMDLLIKEKGFRANRGEERLAELGRPAADRIYMLVHKMMATQVHVEGNGVVGKVALTGVHKWILHGKLGKNYPSSKDLVEMNQQLLAGIHTVAVIPVLPHGVLQLGSTQLIFEEIGFVNHVQHLFMQSESIAQANDASCTVLNQKLQLSNGIQPSVSLYGDVSSNVSALPAHSCHQRENQLFVGHDSRFITRPSPVFTAPLDKASTPSQQMLVNNDISRKRMLPFTNFLQSSCHVINPTLYHNNQLESEYWRNPGTSVSNSRTIEKCSLHLPADVNGSLSPVHLKSQENEFKTYHETTHESVNDHEALVDSSNYLKDCERDSLFCRSGSSIKAENIEKIANSRGIMECIRGIISSENGASQILSPTVDLDSLFLRSGSFTCAHSTSIGNKSLTMSSVGEENHGNGICEALAMPMTELAVHVSDDKLQHISNSDGCWYDSCLVPESRHDYSGSHALANCQNSLAGHNTDMMPPSCIKITSNPHQQKFERTLFGLFDLDQVTNSSHSILDDSFINLDSTGVCEMTTNVSACISQIDASNDEVSCSGRLFSDSSDQLLDAVVSQVKPTSKPLSDDIVSCNILTANPSNLSLNENSPEHDKLGFSEQLSGYFIGQPSNTSRLQHAGANSFKTECRIDRSEGVWPFKDDRKESQISQWVGKARSNNCEVMSSFNCKGIHEIGQLSKKRFRTGENPRPRPKDRQMIQDRVKELREIVPNGAKMSIDALLEKTIKHMLFLQSVTKHADKLKESGKPKIISMDKGLLLKDSFEGGATWAFEVGSQSVICPIIVEDLSSPRHLLVEMLCEKKGFFLEIADSIRGLGLTILKGVMEARDDKVWARFTVEANRDVTRMEVFLYLVHLLDPTTGSAVLEDIYNRKKPHNVLSHSPIPLTRAADCL